MYRKGLFQPDHIDLTDYIGINPWKLRKASYCRNVPKALVLETRRPIGAIRLKSTSVASFQKHSLKRRMVVRSRLRLSSCRCNCRGSAQQFEALAEDAEVQRFPSFLEYP